jgi:predicted HTH transcriptional regulator
MIMDKVSLSKAFSKHYMEFLDEVVKVYPKSVKIRTFRTASSQIKSINPSKLIKMWHKVIGSKYKDQIYSENFDFFKNMDYSSNLKNTKWDSNDIYSFINEMKASWETLSDDNKRKTMKYLGNLTKMAEMYNAMQ